MKNYPLLPNHSSLNQKGFSQLILVGLVAAGIIAGTLLVQNGGNFLPKAAEQGQTGNDGDIDESGEKCSQPVVGRCDGGTYITETWDWDNDQCKLRIRSQIKPETCPVEKSEPQNPKPENNPEQNNSENKSEVRNNGQEALHPIDSGKMAACGSDNNCKDKLCADDEVTFCDNRSGTPRAIRKSGGYYATSGDPHYSLRDSNGCVFDFFEVSSKNSECGKSNSKSGDVVFTTEEEAEKIDSEREKTSVARDRAAGLYKDSTFCSDNASKTYNDAKVANNLARFYAIKNGAGGLCVPVDLGVEHKEELEVNGVNGRLMMCSSKDSPPELYWMIASYKDNSLIAVPKSQKTPPTTNTIEQGFRNLSCARYKAGIDSNPSVCKEG